MPWRRRQKSTNAVPFPSGLAKHRQATHSSKKKPLEKVESEAAILNVSPADAANSAYATVQQHLANNSNRSRRKGRNHNQRGESEAERRRKEKLVEAGRQDPLLQGETITRILQFQKDQQAVKLAKQARHKMAMKRFDTRWKHLVNLHDYLTQVPFFCCCSHLYCYCFKRVEISPTCLGLKFSRTTPL